MTSAPRARIAAKPTAKWPIRVRSISFRPRSEFGGLVAGAGCGLCDIFSAQGLEAGLSTPLSGSQASRPDKVNRLGSL
jgi:hypothetical protein